MKNTSTPFDPDLKAPGYVPPVEEGNPNAMLVELGMDVAEDERRDAGADAYEGSDSPDDFLEDTVVDREGITEAPEVAAIHEEWIPGDSLNDQ